MNIRDGKRGGAMRRYLLMATCLILTLSSTSCESLKSIAASAVPSPPKPKVEMYAIPSQGGSLNSFFPLPKVTFKYANLKTIDSWEGTGSRDIYISVGSNPVVINAAARPTSKLASHFSLDVTKPVPELRGIEENMNGYTINGSVRCFLINQDGNFKIKIDASGVDWWVKVGTE